MIRDDIFRKTEGMLYRYYNYKKKLGRMKHKIEILEQKRQKLSEDLRNTNIVLKSDLQSITYDKPYIQSNNDNSSQAERELERVITRLEEELKKTIKEKLKLRAKVINIEAEIADIEYAINQMNEEAKKIIEMKYGDGCSLYVIADKLNMGKSTVSRKREEIIEDFAKYFEMKRGTKVGQRWEKNK
ncbi:sigma factor-like helix-turn-helix DNA-binding protein [Caloramator proteoclasticus]|uniref:Sigma-70, region 4 n=1 Tax=Caloramator proteoclasticus DSM 10124 TaxID=1121262 RepID=A0A1M4ZFE6_9CLOT|nr:sigma factor-like helix-turn-helix DNA-binding protein [Caloramator proteoclasticus]SHF16685.1 Sigma-70, region 4 [Caloramator proteoclasticus DSM 10124]